MRLYPLSHILRDPVFVSLGGYIRFVLPCCSEEVQNQGRQEI